ncbi:TPA: HD family hydrolase [Enterobacter cancerogenus]|uniref:HD family hydrolase n=1 Tax=Enterobacter cancerogenus TaxID=69218 RepID=UPI001299E2D1|nr:HD family hydrolase [Enterobacter cancerogenus]MRG34235.1 HD family hydrolase [Enterobacter cancerogenus]QZY39561.1 HD family hydrolase [Enterobacter cancerogenus]
MYSEHVIVTFSGIKIDYRNIRVEDINIIDIAKGLSNECRFGGQCENFYSVAQHSILVSYLTPKSLALEALLHDAAEAYIKDFPSPLKRIMPDYLVLEKRFEKAIKDRFCLRQHKSPEIKEADLIMLATECRDLNMESVMNYPTLKNISPSPSVRVEPMKPKAAFQAYLDRFEELTAL